MKNKNIIALAFLLCVSMTNVTGQKISGKIIDEQEEEVEYVNIGVIGKPGGVVSDAHGNFSISLPDSLDANVEVSFSHISYIPQHIKIADIQRIIRSGQPMVVTLVPQAYAIKEVNVTGGIIKEYTFARKGFPGPGYAYPSIPGEEIGSVIETDGNLKVSKIEFKTLKNSYESARLRINVYRVEPDTLVNILQVPVYCDIPTHSKSRVFSISPAELLILDRGKYFISLEFVDLIGEGQLRFPIFLHKSYTREHSMALLKQFPVNIGLSVKGFKLSED